MFVVVEMFNGNHFLFLSRLCGGAVEPDRVSVETREARPAAACARRGFRRRGELINFIF